MKLSKTIADRFCPGYDQEDNPEARTRVGLVEGWLSVATNTVLAGVKLALGQFTGSIALIADGAHTFADSLTSLIVVFGFRMSRKRADKQHPFGHGRMESIAALVIATLLAVVAFEALLAAIGRLREPKITHAPDWVIATVVATVLIKEFLARLSFDLGRMINSQALIADGWHHRSDVLATALVVAAFVAVHWDLRWMDGAMGLGVAAMIGWAAFETMKGAIGPLLGEHASDQVYAAIESVAKSVTGVLGVHDILVNNYGGVSIISLHIEVPASETAIRLHALSEEVEDKVSNRFPGHTIVHVDPLDFNHAHYEEVSRIVSEAVAAHPAATTFHDLRIVGGPERFKAVLDVAFSAESTEDDKDSLRQALLARLHERFPAAGLVLHVEPLYIRSTPDGTIYRTPPSP